MSLSGHSLRNFIFVICSLATSSAYSGHLNSAINIETAINSTSIKSQKKIDNLSDKTRKMLDQYRSVSHQTETLTIYNQHLNELVKSQEQEKISLKEQLKEIETTQREIVPLILRMLNSLEKFVDLDLPFLPEERSQRISKLKQMILRADVTNAEKYRRILEAYQIENDYGNTIEAYRSDLTLEGTTSSVDFLRLGRVALYYQRFDGSETGYWNKEKNQWLPLSNDFRHAIRNGLRIARKESAPNLLTLPIPAAEAGQ